jgi:hypothetical protein
VKKAERGCVIEEAYPNAFDIEDVMVNAAQAREEGVLRDNDVLCGFGYEALVIAVEIKDSLKRIATALEWIAKQEKPKNKPCE